VDAIGPLTCSDGTVLAKVGGNGGSPFSHSAGAGGYTGIDVRAGVLLDAVTLVPVTGSSATFGGGRGGGTAKPSLRCPDQLTVAGIFGTTTPDDVITIGLICRCPPPPPVEARIDPQGGSFSPTSAYERVCPAGARVVSISGRGGDVVDAIGPLTCSDGTVLPVVGGGGGSPFSHSAGAGGYTGIDVRAGVLLDAVTLVPVTGSSATFGGGRGGGTPKPTLRCPSQLTLAGIFGTTTPSDVISIGLICRS
jgi:hypothetical protein